jgi:hypothetical protein
LHNESQASLSNQPFSALVAAFAAGHSTSFWSHLQYYAVAAAAATATALMMAMEPPARSVVELNF